MNSTIQYLLIFLSSSIIIFLIKALYASKCNNVRFLWGCIQIEREVSMENNELRDEEKQNTVSTQMRNGLEMRSKAFDFLKMVKDVKNRQEV
jgi:hypothetical protein